MTTRGSGWPCARGEKPPHRAVQLIHGDNAKLAMANSARGMVEGRFAEGRLERLPALVAGVLRSKVDILVVGSSAGGVFRQ